MAGERLDPCEQIAQSVGYSDGSDGEESSTESLIQYKDALEDALRRVLEDDDTGAGLEGNARRAAFGVAAIDAGTTDRGGNGPDPEGIRTDAKDTIANVLHALRDADAMPTDGFRQVLSAAGDYFWEEVSDEEDPPPIAA